MTSLEPPRYVLEAMLVSKLKFARRKSQHRGFCAIQIWSMKSYSNTYVLLKIPQIPRVRQLRTIPSLEISAKHHNPKALLEESHDQKTADERYFEDWIPSRAGLPPLTRSSLSLLPSVARTSNTLISQVSVGDELGLRISALNKEGIRMAIENLEVLGPCFVCI